MEKTVISIEVIVIGNYVNLVEEMENKYNWYRIFWELFQKLQLKMN